MRHGASTVTSRRSAPRGPDLHRDPPRRQQRRDARRPLDDDHAPLLEQLGEPDRLEVVGPADAVGVEVVDAEARRVVDVEQHERRAADRARVAAEPADEPADELRLAGPEVAVERDARPAAQGRRQRRRDRLGLLDAVRQVNHGRPSHAAPLTSPARRAL
jgi:hypothetical protein